CMDSVISKVLLIAATLVVIGAVVWNQLTPSIQGKGSQIQTQIDGTKVK
ncbi:TPA: hypothetical protein QCV86_005121, partial [Bacillus thuringiensis]|nr:hypothetical protein [Bacillus thuringiensis]HDR6834386.1 hypothetical protein [Bacillus thuringiensis]HDR6860262.1 hypothetical protein [Bacillus thuringiensis]HDR6905399.1 hypothetical protein [Bacillus thuringiensis]HDR6911717.1 hypothetical protein [Bacillus thuringiensis]